jgi:Reverse transcriptase (RNA-dependent DNA polymerase)
LRGFQNIERKTISSVYPLANIQEILDLTGGANYFTSLDLSQGFLQINMNESDKIKTAFTAGSYHYQFNRMSFGLKGAPSTFQRLMNTALAGMLNERVFCYLDDIILYHRTLDGHNKILDDVFQRLRKFNLKLEPSKCNFLKRELVYLGHEISASGIWYQTD